MNIGIFGGTFNPVHNGHVTALKDFIRFAGLDRGFVFPTGIPPHKALTAGASNADRLQMVKLALGTMATVDDYEIRKQGKSYTVDTISYLKQQFPKDALFLYVGSDMLLAFETVWFRFEQILHEVTLVALSRTGDDTERLQKYAQHLNQTYQADVRVCQSRPQVVSSTQVRQRIEQGQSIAGLVPDSVADYIEQHALYRGEKKNEFV